jgi:hypothetical protein
METQEAIARYTAAKEAAEKMKDFYSEELKGIYPRLWGKTDGKPNGLVSFFRKGKRVMRDRDNRPIKKEHVNKFEKTKGHKKGVFVASVNGDDKVIIGFSMCHPCDRFDCIDFMNMRVPDLGIYYAMNMAEKYKDSHKFTVSMIQDDPPKDVVKIPQSMTKELGKFIVRCRKFFTDKQLPEWATNFHFSNMR